MKDHKTHGTGLLWFVAFCFFCAAINAGAQEPEPLPSATATPESTSEISVEEDPTKPIAFSIRNEYRNLKRGSWANTVIFRWDQLTLKNLGNKGGAKGIILRFDIPLNTVHSGTGTKTGLGDLYVQVLHIPHVRRKFALAAGTGVALPTATNDLLGQGKLILAPVVVPIWYFAERKRLLLVRFQNYVSVAGKNSRPDVNYLVADPLLVHRLNRKWWILADTEFKWDWKRKQGSAISGVQLGRMISGKFGFWVKPEVPWGPGRQGDYTFKFTLFRVR